MKRFKNFLIEKEDLSQTTQYGGKAPSGALRRRVVDPAIDFAKEVGSAAKDNPIEFGKQYAQSLLTDPETYHSGLAAAGMVPGVGEVADVIDAAIYAGQGDMEGTKMSLASTVPFAGMIPAIGRFGRSAKALREPLERAEKAVASAKDTWRETKAPEFIDTMQDPFFSRRFLTQNVPATDSYIKLANDFGFEVPRVDNPTASLTPMEILQGVYGKDARKNVELARRAQERATKSTRQGGFKIDVENPSEFLLPDYSDSSLAKKFNVYVGTHYPENVEGTISPLSAISSIAEVDMWNPNSVLINATKRTNKSFDELLAHELTHDLSFQNPMTGWPAVRAISTRGSNEIPENMRGKRVIPPRYQSILNDPNFSSALASEPNFRLIRNYFTNDEIPGQIADAKAWMKKKGLPNVNVNMSQEEATQLRNMVLDKFIKGMFPEFDNSMTVPAIIDIIGSPQGKKLFELIAKKNKGSEVNDRVNQIGYA